MYTLKVLYNKSVYCLIFENFMRVWLSFLNNNNQELTKCLTLYKCFTDGAHKMHNVLIQTSLNQRKWKVMPNKK